MKEKKQEKKEQSRVLQVTVTGLMAALVFVASMIQVPVPISAGIETRLHLGNVFCLLAGLLLGPVRGGLAAGVGSFFFDVINPAYLPSAPFTFLFKFSMGAICGKVARLGGHDADCVPLNFGAAAAGSISYVILYTGKGLVENLLLGMEWAPALAILATKFGVSAVNGLIAVAVSVPLCLLVRKSLSRSRMALL